MESYVVHGIQITIDEAPYYDIINSSTSDVDEDGCGISFLETGHKEGTATAINFTSTAGTWPVGTSVVISVKDEWAARLSNGIWKEGEPGDDGKICVECYLEHCFEITNGKEIGESSQYTRSFSGNGGFTLPKEYTVTGKENWILSGDDYYRVGEAEYDFEGNGSAAYSIAVRAPGKSDGLTRVVVSTSPRGDGNTSPRKRVFILGSANAVEARLSATPNAGSKFVRWSNGDVKANTSVSCPAYYGRTSYYHFTGYFEKKENIYDPPDPSHPYAPGHDPTSGESGCYADIVVYTDCNPDGVATTEPNYSYHGPCNSSISIGISSTKSNDAEYADYEFSGWTGDGGIVDASSENTSVNLTFPKDGSTLVVRYVANYRNKNKFYVSVSTTPKCMCPGVAGGGGEYEPGSRIGVWAEATSSGRFCHWEVNGIIVSTSRNYYFEVVSDMHLIAVFSVVFPDNMILADDNGTIYRHYSQNTIMRNGDDINCIV